MEEDEGTNTHGCKEPQEAARRAGQCGTENREGQWAERAPRPKKRCQSAGTGGVPQTRSRTTSGGGATLRQKHSQVQRWSSWLLQVVVAVGAANVVVEGVGAGKASAGVTSDDVEVDVVVACERRVSLKKRL